MLHAGWKGGGRTIVHIVCCSPFLRLLVVTATLPLFVSSFTNRPLVKLNYPRVCKMHADDAVLIIDPVTEWREVLSAVMEKGTKSIAIISNPLSGRDDIARFIPTPSVLKEGGFDHVIDVDAKQGNDLDLDLEHTARTFAGLDVYAAAQRIKLLEREENLVVRGVVPLSETGVEYSDVLSALLGISSHNSLDRVLARRDKALMKEAVASKGLRVAKFARLDKPNDISAAVKSLGIDYPLVVKTPHGFSSTDVFICKDEAVAISALTAILDGSGGGPDCRPVAFALVEEYIHGEEFAVNVLASASGGVVCTDVWLYHKTISAESGSPRYDRADMMDPNDSKLHVVIEYAIQVACAVGIAHGAGHIELKAVYCPASEHYINPCLIEVGARLSGGRKASLSKEVISGWDPFHALIDSHCGNEVKLPKSFSPRDKVASHLFLQNAQSGVVISIEGTEYINSLETHYAHAILTKVGDRVEPTNDITSSAGFVWLVGSWEDVEKDSAQVKKAFRTNVESSDSDCFRCPA
mmetsp:Transcript_4062/g.11564  ORF Transcript_4062/g.11564 Transcript_4062/m.11564 type:complete len:523 (+) Transcript_4062:1-1569(+)